MVKELLPGALTSPRDWYCGQQREGEEKGQPRAVPGGQSGSRPLHSLSQGGRRDAGAKGAADAKDPGR